MFRVIKDVNVRLKVVNYWCNVSQKRCASSKELVASADVVIIGGGIAGSNTLYQLTKRGVNAVLLERGKITSGTTWHTAGGVFSLRTCDMEIKLLRDSRSVYGNLHKECEDFAGWINTGGMFVSRSKKRTQEYMRLHSLGKALGIPSYVLTPDEAKKKFPLLDPSVFEMALFSPEDGIIDPAMVCDALLKVATRNGGKVYEDTPVLDIQYAHNFLGNKEVTGVHTDKGLIQTKCLVNCGGAWGPRVARFADIPSLPLIPFKHAYVVMADAMPEIRGSPLIKDPDASLYMKNQGEICSLGGYEDNPIMLDQVPDNFQFHLYELNWDVFGVHLASAATLCPKLGKVGIKTTICGPESFTPDHKPLLGEDPNIFGLYHNCGYNSAGMMLSAGCAIQVAEWIVSGRPAYNMFTYDIRRFTPDQLSRPHWVRESSYEAYITNYGVAFPHDEPLAGRDVTHDALHQELVDDGAVMQARAGWERPAFFIPGEKIRIPQYDWGGNNDFPRNLDKRYADIVKEEHTFDFSKHHELIGKEALSCRNSATLFNLSSCGKFYLTGPDAQRTAELAFTADLSKTDNRVVYSLLLNEKGGVEADVSVSTLDGESGLQHEPNFKGRGYYVVTSGFNSNHTLAHLRRVIQTHRLHATLTDVTKQLCVLSVQGPKSQSILHQYIDASLTNDAFPENTYKNISFSKAPNSPDNKAYSCRALRVSWTGELGWELHVPSADAVQVYKALRSAGLNNAGWRALASLNAEKGYHLWNADLRSDDNPAEANLVYACRKDSGYIGYEHVEKAKTNGVNKKYAFFTLDDKVPIFGKEAVYRNGELVGFLRRGDYAYYLDKSIGSGYITNNGSVVTKDFLTVGHYEIEVIGKKSKATLHLTSPFDPKGQRIAGDYGKSNSELLVKN